MPYEPRRKTFNPLILGAIVVVAALLAFLVFREGTDATQQARIDPPASTNPSKGPNAGPPGSANPAPSSPDIVAKQQQTPGAK